LQPPTFFRRLRTDPDAHETEIPMLKRTLALTAGLALSFSTLLAQAADVLKVSAIPDEAPTELLRKFEPLGAYLEQQLGMKVQFVPVADYPAVVEALATDRLDMAWLGGFTFVQARLKTDATTPVIPLVQREQDAQFTSKFITADPNVKSLTDLKGKTFAFGSVSSTSGSLMPRYFMLKDGIKPETYFSRVGYSGAHDATVAWVQAGKVDAGVLNASVWQKLVDAGKVDTNKVKVFATTPAYFDYNWTVRGTLDPALAAKIKKAFLALDPANPEQKKILDLQAASRFIETSPDNYKGIEEAARAAELLK
jgi:phosphonate transport system substrate-binding protein